MADEAVSEHCVGEELNIKEMAEAEGKGPALNAADRYRQWAAIGEFRIYLKQAAAKNASTLSGKETANSTRTCWACGGYIEKSGQLILECENGHREDQDRNTALLFLREETSQTPQEIMQKIGVRKNESEITGQRGKVPNVFGAVAPIVQ